MMLQPKAPLAYAIFNPPGGFAGAQVFSWWRRLYHVAVEIRNILTASIGQAV